MLVAISVGRQAVRGKLDLIFPGTGEGKVG